MNNPAEATPAGVAARPADPVPSANAQVKAAADLGKKQDLALIVVTAEAARVARVVMAQKTRDLTSALAIHVVQVPATSRGMESPAGTKVDKVNVDMESPAVKRVDNQSVVMARRAEKKVDNQSAGTEILARMKAGVMVHHVATVEQPEAVGLITERVEKSPGKKQPAPTIKATALKSRSRAANPMENPRTIIVKSARRPNVRSIHPNVTSENPTAPKTNLLERRKMMVKSLAPLCRPGLHANGNN